MKNPVLHAPSLVRAWIPAVYSAALFLLLWWLGRAYDRSHAPDVVILLAIGIALVVSASVEVRAELGAEGIALRWLLRSRSVSYADIRRATPDGRKKVTVETTAGEALVLSAGYLDEAAAGDMLERLWKAIAAGAQEGTRGLERDTLARSGRTIADWRKALRELGAPAGYRSAHFSAERLVAIAENPGIAAELRTAAVVALTGGDLDARARARLRDAARVTIDQRLRALLEKLATPGEALDEDACDAVLERA